MISANSAVFRRLADYCADHGVEIADPRGARWVHANPSADAFLIGLDVRATLSFGRHRHLAWLEHQGEHYLALVGFTFEPDDLRYAVLDDVQGFDVCLLAELPIYPTASAAQVRNVVEAGIMGDPGYIGHDNAAIMDLFPTIQLVQNATPLQEVIAWPAFLTLCVQESLVSGSWIQEPLAGSLVSLAELEVPSLPYQELCRAVLDLDPRNVYMSLYRCIEATYAYDRATALAKLLSVTLPWHEIAAQLDAEMGWRPPELQSLNATLAHANESDLYEICDCLNATVGKDVRASAGRAIYLLRNKIVHYRPTTEPFRMDSVDWNRACNLLVAISVEVFDHAYGA
ncbi:hypothetical protein [Cellulomonas xylanilytica]|uniref:Uncharacterized protein n=1 Tax=Cellulomonas xylanilytica TaxID=233583 RepID=A0A510V837_9CELL|nr:hypothetical protein [Cellulomonas xylanilytica]GEK21430.1 hypothetical protein CXY01_19500 [Cellulomonas xylanilytica]